MQIHNAGNARAGRGRVIEEKHLATPLRFLLFFNNFDKSREANVKTN